MKRDDADLTPELRRVLVGLMALGPCSEYRLARNLNLLTDDCITAVRRLRGLGLVTKLDREWMDVTEEGRAVVLAPAPVAEKPAASRRATNFWGR